MAFRARKVFGTFEKRPPASGRLVENASLFIFNSKSTDILALKSNPKTNFFFPGGFLFNSKTGSCKTKEKF